MAEDNKKNNQNATPKDTSVKPISDFLELRDMSKEQLQQNEKMWNNQSGSVDQIQSIVDNQRARRNQRNDGNKSIDANRLNNIGNLSNERRQALMAREVADRFGGFPAYRIIQGNTDDLFSQISKFESLDRIGKHVELGHFDYQGNPFGINKDNISDIYVSTKGYTQAGIDELIAKGFVTSDQVVTSNDGMRKFNEINKKLGAFNTDKDLNILSTLKRAKRSSGMISVESDVAQVLGIEEGLVPVKNVEKSIYTFLTEEKKINTPVDLTRQRGKGIFDDLLSTIGREIGHQNESIKDPLTKQRKKLLRDKELFVENRKMLNYNLNDMNDQSIMTGWEREQKWRQTSGSMGADEWLEQIYQELDSVNQHEQQARNIMAKVQGKKSEKEGASELSNARHKQDNPRFMREIDKATTIQSSGSDVTLLSDNDIKANIPDHIVEPWKKIADRGGRYQFKGDMTQSMIRMQEDGKTVEFVRDHIDLGKEKIKVEFETNLDEIQRMWDRFSDRKFYIPHGERLDFARSVNAKTGNRATIDIPLTDELRERYNLHSKEISSFAVEAKQVIDDLMQTTYSDQVNIGQANVRLPEWMQGKITEQFDWMMRSASGMKDQDRARDLLTNSFMSLRTAVESLTNNPNMLKNASSEALGKLEAGDIPGFFSESLADNFARGTLANNGSVNAGGQSKYDPYNITNFKEKRVFDMIERFSQLHGSGLDQVTDDMSNAITNVMMNDEHFDAGFADFLERTQRYQDVINMTPIEVASVVDKIKNPSGARKVSADLWDGNLGKEYPELQRALDRLSMNQSSPETIDANRSKGFIDQFLDEKAKEEVSEKDVQKRVDTNIKAMVKAGVLSPRDEKDKREETRQARIVRDRMRNKARNEIKKSNSATVTTSLDNMNPSEVKDLFSFLEGSKSKITDGDGNEHTIRSTKREPLLYNTATGRTKTIALNGRDANGNNISGTFLPNQKQQPAKDRTKYNQPSYQASNKIRTPLSKGEIPLVTNFNGDYKDVAAFSQYSPYDTRENIRQVIDEGRGASVADFETTGTAQQIDEMGDLNQIVEISSRNVMWDESRGDMVQKYKKDHLRIFVKPNQKIIDTVNQFEVDKAFQEVANMLEQKEYKAAEEFMKNQNEISMMINLAKYSRVRKTDKTIYEDHKQIDNLFRKVNVSGDDISDYLENLKTHAISGNKYLNQYGKDLGDALNRFDSFVGDRAIVAQYGLGAERQWLDHNAKMAGVNLSKNSDDWIEMMHLSRTVNPDARRHRLEDQIKRAGRKEIGPAYDRYFDEQHIASADTDATRSLFGHYGRRLKDNKSISNPRMLQESDFLVKFKASNGEEGLRGVYEINEFNAEDGSYRLSLSDIDSGAADEILGQDIYEDGQLIKTARQSFEEQFHNKFFAVGKRETAMAFSESMATDSARDVIQSAQSGFHNMTSARRKQQMIDNVYNSDNPTAQYVKDEQLGRMHDAYTGAYDKYQTEGWNSLSATEQKLLDNYNVLDADFGDRQYRYVSENEITDYNYTSDYFNSAEADLDQRLLANVHRMEQVGAVDAKASASIIEEWNETKKQRAREVGRERQAKPVAGLMDMGKLGENFGGRQGTNLYVQAGSVDRVVDSLWKTVNAHVPYTQSEVAGLDETQAKGRVINEYLLPRLNEIDGIDTSKANSDHLDSNMKLQSVALQLQNKYETEYLREGRLGDEIVDETTPLITSKDDELYDTMKQEINNIIDKQVNLSPSQQASTESIREIQKNFRVIMGSDIGHIEGLNVTRSGRAQTVLQTSMALDGYNKNGRFAGIENMSGFQIKESLMPANADNPRAMGTIFSELKRRISDYDTYNSANPQGDPNNIDQMLAVDDSSQLSPYRVEAAEALDRAKVLRMDEQGQLHTTDELRQMSLNDANNIIEQSQIIDMKAGDVEILERDEEGRITKYRQGNPDDFILASSTVQDASGQNIMGRRLGDMSIEDLRSIETAKYTFGIDRGIVERQIESITEELNTANGSEGINTSIDQQAEAFAENARTAKETTQYVSGKDWVSPIGDNAPTSYAERGLNKAFDSLQESLHGKWGMIGIGAAALGTAGLIFSGGPQTAAPNLTPEGQEYAQEGDMDRDQAIAAASQASSQTTARLQQGASGYQVNINGRHNGQLDNGQLGNLIGQGIGQSANINVNSQDDTQNIDNEWLGQKFSELLSRGYVSE